MAEPDDTQSDASLANYLRKKAKGFRIVGVSSPNFARHLKYLEDDKQLFGLLQRTGHNLDELRAEWLRPPTTNQPNLDKAKKYLQEFVWQSQFPTGKGSVEDYGKGGNSRMPFTGQTRKPGSRMDNRGHKKS
jgi:hypothetical protein